MYEGTLMHTDVYSFAGVEMAWKYDSLFMYHVWGEILEPLFGVVDLWDFWNLSLIV